MQGNVSEGFRRTVWWLIVATRGGRSRARIIVELKKRPMNVHQLSELLNTDYKTTRQHVGLLFDNRLLTRVGEKYGAAFFVSSELEAMWDDFIKMSKGVGVEG